MPQRIFTQGLSKLHYDSSSSKLLGEISSPDVLADPVGFIVVGTPVGVIGPVGPVEAGVAVGANVRWRRMSSAIDAGWEGGRNKDYAERSGAATHISETSDGAAHSPNASCPNLC